MKCKICGEDLTDVINELYFCENREDKTHTYIASCVRAQVITEEYKVLDVPMDTGYVVWIDHNSRETHLKIVQGHKILQSKVLKDTVINLDLTTEKSIIDRVSKLMVLF